jgi:glycosyltransferase involved in cell wall biosynthesis
MKFRIFSKAFRQITARLFPTGEIIRDRLDSIRELDPDAYSTLAAKIEFQFIRRQKLRMRRVVRKYVLRRPDTRTPATTRQHFIDFVNNAEGEKVIVFVVRHPTHDFIKASDFLRREGGYKTAILMFHPTLRPVMEEHFDEVWVYPSLYDLCSVLIQIQPWLIHAQGSSSFYPFPALAKTMSDSPVISQVMDVPSNAKPTAQHYADRGGMSEYTLDTLLQNYPYAHTEGVTLFNYQISITDRMINGVSNPAPVIEFHNYPAKIDCVSPKNRSLKNDGTHIVYAGTVEPSSLPRKHYADLQFHNLIKKITDQGLHFHIYPSPQYEAAGLRDYLREYVEIDQANPFYHYHDPVPPGRTAEELSQYHYASLMYTLEDIDEYDFVRMYQEAGGIGSKVFTYLEAGLPLIVNNHSTEPARLVEQYKNGLVIQESQLDQLSEVLASQDYDLLNDGVVHAQESLSLDNQAKRLLDLYESVGNTATPEAAG